MKLIFALFLSVCTLSTGYWASTASAAKISSGESGVSNEKLTRQLILQNEKVRTLEADNQKLRETVDALKLLVYAPDARKAQMSHSIKEGESVTQIANRNGISREMLMKVNHISENQQIYIGDVLIIPPAPPTEEEGLLVVNTKATPAPKPSKVKTSPAPKPAPKKKSSIAWTQTEKTKTEKAAPAPLVITVVAKTEPKKVEAPKVKPVTVAKVEPKPEVKPVTVAKVEPKPVVEVAESSPAKKESSKPAATKIELAKIAEENIDSGFTYYTIKFGDNLGKIAKKHGIPVGVLMNFNDIKNPNKISGGQKLKIPSKEAAKSLSKLKTRPVPVVASSGDKPQPGDAYGIYVVQSGDNLYDLARDFFTTQKEIQTLNKMGNKTDITPGQDLIVPTAEYVKKSALANN